MRGPDQNFISAARRSQANVSPCHVSLLRRQLIWSPIRDTAPAAIQGTAHIADIPVDLSSREVRRQLSDLTKNT